MQRLVGWVWVWLRLRLLPALWRRPPVGAQLLQRLEQAVLARAVRLHVAVLLQQDAVQRALVVDVPSHHQHVLTALLHCGAVAHVGHPQELTVLQTVAVTVRVNHLNVIASLLTTVTLLHDLGTEH